MRMRGMLAALLFAVIPVSAGSSAELRPLVAGWEQFFKLDWQPGERKGKPVVQGHVYNNWGFPAKDVRLLVEGLDADGRVVWQKVDRVAGELTPGTRAPFEVPVPEPGPAYRVSVFSFDWIQLLG